MGVNNMMTEQELLNRERIMVEIDKMRAEAEKMKAETEKARDDAEKSRAEIAKINKETKYYPAIMIMLAFTTSLVALVVALLK